MQARRQVREDRSRTGSVGGAGARDDRGDGSEDLRAHQGEDDVKPRQRLQKDHTEADALDRVQGAEPEPEGPTRQSASEGGTRPRDPLPHARDGPQHLTPARRTEADGEHG